MKACPFCAESIQDEAVKCRYCGEFLDAGGAGATTAKPVTAVRSEKRGKNVMWETDGSAQELLKLIDWAAQSVGFQVVERSYENLSLTFESDKPTMGGLLGVVGYDRVAVNVNPRDQGSDASFAARKKPVGVQRSQPVMNAERYTARLLAAVRPRLGS